MERINHSAKVLRESKKNYSEWQVHNAVSNSRSKLLQTPFSSNLPLSPRFEHCFKSPFSDALLSLIAETDLSKTSALIVWIVSVSIACGNKVKIRCDEHWIETTSTLFNIVICSGARKSAVAQRAYRLFKSFLKEKNQGIIKDDASKSAAKKVLKLLENENIRNAFFELQGLSSKQARFEFLKSFAKRNSEEVGFSFDEYAILLETCTLSGLMKHLSANSEQVGIITAEADALNSILFKNKSDPSMFNKLNMQEPNRYVTAYKSYNFIRPTLSMLNLIQPNIAQKLYLNENLRETGAAARILPYFDPLCSFDNTASDETCYIDRFLDKKYIKY